MAPAGNLGVGMEISRDQKVTGEDAYETVNFTNNSSTYYVCWPYHASTYANPLTAIAGEPGFPLSSVDSADSLSLSRQRWVTPNLENASCVCLCDRQPLRKEWDPGPPNKHNDDTTQYYHSCSKRGRGDGGVVRTASDKHEWNTHTPRVRRSIRTIRYVETIRHRHMSLTDRVHHMTNLRLHWLTPVRVAGRTGRGSFQGKWAVSTESRESQRIKAEDWNSQWGTAAPLRIPMNYCGATGDN